MIQQYLLSHNEMERKTQSLSEDYEYPYFYSIQNGDKDLYFLGIKHLHNNPDDEQIPRILKYWGDFLEQTKNKSRIVIIEGRVTPLNGSENQTESVRLDGERGLMTNLANRLHIEIINGEPTWEYKIEELLKIFTKEEILYNFFCVAVYSWNNLKNERPSLKTYVEPLLGKYKEKSNWNDVEFSFENMIAIHNKKNSHPFSDIGCKQCAYEEIHPAKGKFANNETIIRNVSLVENIITAWTASKNVFVVYGAGHAFVCEPALKKLLK